MAKLCTNAVVDPTRENVVVVRWYMGCRKDGSCELRLLDLKTLDDVHDETKRDSTEVAVFFTSRASELPSRLKMWTRVSANTYPQPSAEMTLYRIRYTFRGLRGVLTGSAAVHRVIRQKKKKNIEIITFFGLRRRASHGKLLVEGCRTRRSLSLRRKAVALRSRNFST